MSLQSIPTDEQRHQEIEIILSHDFDKMTLEQLEKLNDDYVSIQKQGETIHWTDMQYKTWQYMHLRIKEEKNKDDTIKEGDLFASSWGYDQTNVEFFKVVKISKTRKTCQVVQVAAESIGDDARNQRNMSDSASPDPDHIINEKPCKVRIERASDRNPYTNKVVKVGEIQLRGSVYYGTSGNYKHLTTLMRVKGPMSRSWYA